MKSKRSSARQPALAPPEFLIDRSLGRIQLPTALRAEGLAVYTLAEVYGESEAQEVPDVDWIALAAARRWVVLCKDDRIRRRPAELQALIAGNVRVFCLTNANLGFAGQSAYFVANKNRIIQAAARPGPYLYGVYRDHIKKLWPPVDS